MKIKSVFYYLYSFTPEDWKAFVEIIELEYQDQPEMIALIKKASRKRKQLKIPMTGDISRRLFEEHYSIKNFHKYLDLLEKRIVQFFKDQVAQRDELLLDRTQALLKFSNRKGLEDFFLNEVRAFEIEMNDLVYLTRAHYFALHVLNDKAHFLHHGARETRSFHKYLWKSAYYLKVYQLFYAIRTHVESHFFHQVYKVDPNLEIRHDVDQLIQKAKFYAQNPLLQLYLHILMGIHESFSVQAFQDLGTQFESIARHLPEQERLDLAGFIMNLAAKQINTGNGAYRVPCLQFYLKWTRQGLLFLNDLFSDQTYLSVVDLAASLHAFDDLKDFKQKVENKLSLPKRAELIRIGQLIEYFHQGQYQKCTKLYLQQPIPNEPSLKIRVRVLLLRAYFMVAIESADKEQFLLEAENFRGYCNYSRQEDMGQDRKRYLANLREQLLSVFQAYESGKQKISAKNKALLQRTIENTEMYGGPWLLHVLKNIAEA